ncbi:MAG: hypothetical protein ABIP89_16765 [Polyangiaceae bacterium]
MKDDTKLPRSEDPGKEAANEGPRAFGVLLTSLDDGALHAELSEEVQKVTSALVDLVEKYGVDQKGQITLVLNLKALRSGMITVTSDVRTKTPKVRRGGTAFFATKAGNLTVDHPRQEKLPLREVPRGEAKVVDAPAVQPVRNV